MKIIIGSDHLGVNFPEQLQDLFPSANIVKAFTEDEQLKHIKNSTVYFGFPSKEIIAKGENLEWIACPGTGIDKIINNSKELQKKTIMS